MRPLTDIQLGIKAEVGQITRKFINNDGIDKSILPKQTTKSATRTKYAIPITPCTCHIELKDGTLILDEDYELIKQYIELVSAFIQLCKLQNQ